MGNGVHASRRPRAPASVLTGHTCAQDRSEQGFSFIFFMVLGMEPRA
jgi:hypothetical protein